MPRQNLGRVKGDKGDPFTFDDFTSGQLDGITPKMVLGNVTTLGPDENAAVNMRKEGLKNYVDFAIPRGKNGAEAKNIPAENVEMADKTTLESAMATVNESVNTNNTEINKIKTPTFTDTVGTYTTLNAANTAAETASNAIKSKVNILTTLSNMKKSFSAIVQGLKILATNVGMIQGITSDLNSESDYIAASSKALATLNGNLGSLGNLVLSDSPVIISNPSELDSYKTDGIHTVLMQSNEPFINGGLYLLEVKTQTFTNRENGYVQTMTRIYPVTGQNASFAFVLMRTVYNTSKGDWITVC